MNSEEQLKKYSALLMCNLLMYKTGRISLEEYERIKIELKNNYEKIRDMQ